MLGCTLRCHSGITTQSRHSSIDSYHAFPLRTLDKLTLNQDPMFVPCLFTSLVFAIASCRDSICVLMYLISRAAPSRNFTAFTLRISNSCNWYQTPIELYLVVTWAECLLAIIHVQREVCSSFGCLTRKVFRFDVDVHGAVTTSFTLSSMVGSSGT